MKNKQDKVWIVTGASGGLGLAVVKTLLANNIRVAAFSRSAERLEQAVGSGETDLFLPLSVRLHVEQDVIDAKKKVLDKFGAVDVVVNNAGHGQRGAFEEVTDFELRRVFDDDFFSQLNMLRHFIPVFREEGGGYFINLGSVGSFKSKPGSGAYCSAKYSVDALTVAVNKECAGFNIKATCVKPFDLRTNYLSSAHLDMPSKPVPCYAPIHEEHRIDDEETHGAQPGDPMKVAQLFIDLAEMDHVPESLFLDYPAAWLIKKIHTERSTELEKWAYLAKSVEY